jgi:hypothetical protein
MALNGMGLELYMVGVIVSDMGRAPYDVTPDLRFAMVDDPDGNTILLSAALHSGTQPG